MVAHASTDRSVAVRGERRARPVSKIAHSVSRMRPSKSKMTASSGHASRAAAAGDRAATRPSMVWTCGLDVDREAVLGRAVAAVTGPMHATTGGTPSAPKASTNRSTVDDDVNVIGVGATPRPAARR